MNMMFGASPVGAPPTPADPLNYNYFTTIVENKVVLQNDSPTLGWYIYNNYDVPVDLTNDDIYMTASTPGAFPVGVFEVSNSRFTINPDGYIEVTLNNTETATSQTLVYYIWTSGSPDAVIVARGRLEIVAMLSPNLLSSSSS
jgi:hypothetical protein